MRKIINKRGGFTDLFLFMIAAVIIVFFSVIFIYTAREIQTNLHSTLDKLEPDNSSVNYSQTIDSTIGATVVTFKALQWISIFLILGMMIAIFIGSYFVQTKPIMFVPYIFISIIAIISAVGISMAYDEARLNTTLASTFAEFTAANFILLYLPIWITVVSIGGGIIMFSRMRRGEEYAGY